MKKLIVLGLLLLSLSVMANDKTINYVDTIVIADTIAEAINADTLYSDIFDIRGMTRFQFFYHITSHVAYLDLVEDTFYVNFQHSFNRLDWLNVEVGLSDDTVAVWSTINMAVADSVVGNWGRYRVIHRDSTDADSPDSLGNIGGAKIKLWNSNIK